MNPRAHMRAKLANQRGMTLVEIMVVIAIIGIVTTAIGFAVVGYMSDARIESARMQVKKVSAAAAQYYRSTGEVPSSVDALVDRKYIKKADKKDPWKTELSLESIESPDQPVRVCSFGADMKSGGDDDICDPEQD
jgi:general secretion pathway protein G